MKYKKLIHSICFSTFLLALTNLQAQEATLSSGAEAVGAGGNVSYSVGQVGSTTQSGTNGSVELGVQQTYSILTSLGAELTSIQLELSAYPNPTSRFLTLKVEDYKQEKLSYYLYSLQGKLLEIGQVTTGNTNISVEHLPSSTYFLKIEQEKQIIKSFSIIKN